MFAAAFVHQLGGVRVWVVSRYQAGTGCSGAVFWCTHNPTSIREPFVHKMVVAVVADVSAYRRRIIYQVCSESAGLDGKFFVFSSGREVKT